MQRVQVTRIAISGSIVSVNVSSGELVRNVVRDGWKNAVQLSLRGCITRAAHRCDDRTRSGADSSRR
jgi:hypothetical protein